MDDDHDNKTRVTPFEELTLPRIGNDCLVIIHAAERTELGKRYLLQADVIRTGRDSDNDIVLDSDLVSRRHARVESRDKGFVVIDLDSTNGTFVNDQLDPVDGCQLRRGDQIRVGDTIFKYLAGSDVEAQYHETIFKMTITDGLTGLSNRMQLDSALAKEIPRALRHGRELSLLMIDVDRFKGVNDTYGHMAGDAVLRDLAGLLARRLRPGDELGRYGGEEFCAILPETPLDGAVRIADDLRVLAQDHAFVVEGQRIAVTLSIGAAGLRKDMHAQALYTAADEMLYQAKRTGRNRVCAPTR